MWARHRLEWVTAALAVVLGVIYLLLPPMGSDLAAQVARAGFFADHGYTPVDLRWYAGVDQLGYSLVSQPVMALLGVRVTGVLSLVGAAVLLAVLLRRTGAPRPWLGAVVGTVCVAGNLVSGRVTYGLGVFFALAALVALTGPRLCRLAFLPALLASATSPVAGLFVGLAGVALALSGRVAGGLLIALPAAVPLGLSALLFGDGGWMNISRTDTIRAVVAGLAVALLVPRRAIRIGAVLSAAGVLAAALIHTPVGLNATRLAVMFTLPLLAAYAAVPWRTTGNRQARVDSTSSPRPIDGPAAGGTSFRGPAGGASAAGPAGGASAAGPSIVRRVLAGAGVVVLLAVACWWQPPVVTADLRDIGNPSAEKAYFAPLLDRLRQEQLTGRVEIPATRAYWEAARMGDTPLARGWLRQADIDRNPLFFTDIPGARGTGVPLNQQTYRDWLAQLAVQFVAVPDAELTWSGRPEAELVTGGLPYLAMIWSNEHWRLYAVTDPQPIVAPPATLVGHTASTLTVEVPAGADITVRVRYHRWLRATGGAVVEPTGDWTLLRAPGPGRYTITS